MYIYIYVYLCMYIHVYICMCKCICVCICEEIEKFIIRQPPIGKKNDYDSENS